MPHNLHAYDNSTWLCEPGALHRLAVRVAAHPTCPTARDLAKARRKLFDGIDGMLDRAVRGTGRPDPSERNLAAPGKSIRAVKGKIGVIPIHGPVDQRMNAELDKAGGTPLDWVSAVFARMLDDAGIDAIVLHVDSPGGSSYGTEELAQKIYDARGRKQIVAIADSMAASAAFWIGSAASMFVATPGGDVGSVGVYAMHVDKSKMMELEGLQVTMVSAGEFKTELSPYGPLSEAAQEELQRRVDETYAKFVGGVALNRGVSVGDVRKNYGKGRLVSADDALAAGMIDRVMPFDALLAKLTGAGAATGGTKAVSDEMRRMKEVRAEQRRRLSESLGA